MKKDDHPIKIYFKQADTSKRNVWQRDSQWEVVLKCIWGHIQVRNQTNLTTIAHNITQNTQFIYMISEKSNWGKYINLAIAFMDISPIL